MSQEWMQQHVPRQAPTRTVEQEKLEEQEQQLKQMEQGYVVTYPAKSGYGERGQPTTVVYEAGTPAWRREYEKRYVGYEQAYRNYMARQRLSQHETYDEYLMAKDAYYRQRIKTRREQALAREKSSILRKGIAGMPPRPGYTRTLKYEGGYIVLTDRPVPRDLPVGEQKAREAFAQPTWRETTLAGQLLSFHEHMESHPQENVRALWRRYGGAESAGFVGIFEETGRSWYSLFTGQPQPNIPEPVGEGLASLQLQPAQFNLAVAHPGPRFRVVFQPTPEWKELEQLGPSYWLGTAAGEVAMTWLSTKALSWVGKKITPHLPERIRRVFIKREKTVTRKYETYPAQTPLRTETIPYGFDPLKGTPSTYPLSWEHPALSPKGVQIWYRYAGKGAQDRGLTTSFIKFTRGHPTTPMTKTLERTVSAGSQQLVLQTAKQTPKVVTKVTPQILAESIKVVSKPTTTAKALSVASGYVAAELPRLWRKQAPPPSRTEMEQTPWVVHAPYPTQKYRMEQKQRVNQQAKQAQRTVLESERRMQDLFTTQLISWTRLRMREQQKLRQITPVIQRLRFDTATQPKYAPPALVVPPVPSPRGGIPPTFPPFRLLKKRGVKRRKGAVGGGWMVHIWPVRTIRGYEDLQRMVGI